ncbi:MAG: alkyl hydroperoxide reductase [Bdellovibrionales bacterium RIFCSPHIGHO2_01_FULL_40_29]|nr:MAG: alkyl hydroperoxide reductase [Bdellovibrionales bacterium RIFCSPHIGHO2_01_FULL_40_29]OFZ33831.1 MAG: alkyl hydroperoxide reductase [Bdellovibrionales bacterium RIFCSPHIGHO2_02_FULL_40_15]
MPPVYTPENPEFKKPCPDFTLPSVDGVPFSLSDFKKNKPFVILFICNHCPYVQAIEDRLIQLGHDLKKLDIPVVAICSNDEITYPEDSLENLRKRFHEKKYSFIYLHDKTQEVAKKFGALCTPDYFVYDQNAQLAYRGRLDDSWKDPLQVTTRELYEAILELSEGKPISRPQVPSMGCSIKWIKND